MNITPHFNNQHVYGPGIRSVETWPSCKIAIQNNDIEELRRLIPRHLAICEQVKSPQRRFTGDNATAQRQYAQDDLLRYTIQQHTKGSLNVLLELLALGVWPASKGISYASVECHPLYAACNTGGLFTQSADRGWPEGLRALCQHFQEQGLSLDELSIQHNGASTSEFVALLYKITTPNCAAILKEYVKDPNSLKTEQEKKRESDAKELATRIEVQQKLSADFLAQLGHSSFCVDTLMDLIATIRPVANTQQENAIFQATLDEAFVYAVEAQNEKILQSLLDGGFKPFSKQSPPFALIAKICQQKWAMGLDILCLFYTKNKVFLDRLMERLNTSTEQPISLRKIYDNTSSDCQKILERAIIDKTYLFQNTPMRRHTAPTKKSIRQLPLEPQRENRLDFGWDQGYDNPPSPRDRYNGPTPPPSTNHRPVTGSWRAAPDNLRTQLLSVKPAATPAQIEKKQDCRKKQYENNFPPLGSSGGK